MSDLKLLPVTLVDGLWYPDTANEYGYSGWFTGGVQALARRGPIPEPGTLMLIVPGLLSLRMLARKRVKNRK